MQCKNARTQKNARKCKKNARDENKHFWKLGQLTSTKMCIFGHVLEVVKPPPPKPLSSHCSQYTQKFSNSWGASVDSPPGEGGGSRASPKFHSLPSAPCVCHALPKKIGACNANHFPQTRVRWVLGLRPVSHPPGGLRWFKNGMVQTTPS